ncbi:MAG: class I SAM-dependent methyltransferase [Planctomycetes bacterium]|nr:class I SAM-dependent methyltransferase [Planctomycetota bacterium]
MMAQRFKPDITDTSNGVNDYQQVKKSYQSADLANRYDKKRFKESARKQLLNRQLMTALTGVLNYAGTNGCRIDSVLDMPCGTGRAFSTLLNKGIRFIGADISLEMMLQSRSIPDAKDAPLVQCDGARMPFKNGSFDAIASLRFLTTFIPQEARAPIFREMSRVSRGWVIIECRHENILSIVGEWIFQNILRRPPRFNYFSRDAIKQELEQAGIKLEKVYCPYGLSSNKWLLLGRVMPGCCNKT